MSAAPYTDDEIIPMKKVTEIVPFNITAPKPKMMPAPEEPPAVAKANPVPRGMFKTSLGDIQKQKDDRRKATIEAVRKEYEDNSKKRFELTTEQRPTATKFEQKKKEIETLREAELMFDGTKPRKMPDFDRVEAPVKLTAAAVKREALALKKEAELEAKRLKDLEMHGRDETEFMMWKREMDERDDVLRMEHIQRKKIEMELSRDEAILAQKKKTHENKLNARDMKIEANSRAEQRETESKELLEKKMEVVEQVHSQKDKASEAMEEKRKENREVRDVMNKEITDALQRKKEEEAALHAKRQELIRQIRELEKIPIIRTKGFDPTEAGGHGLLEEMSIAELRERIEH